MKYKNRVKLCVIFLSFLFAGSGLLWADMLASWDVNGVNVIGGI